MDLNTWQKVEDCLPVGLQGDASVIEALRHNIHQALIAERERCANIAEEHRAHVVNHDPEERNPDNLVGHGYGNAALNIAIAIRTWRR